MPNALSKTIALIIAVMLLFIFPIKSEFERQDEISRMFVLTETTKLVDSVRNLGYITPVMYQEYANKLAMTNNIYEIKLEHYRMRYDPVYDDPTVAATFKNSFNVNYDANFTEDILEKLFTDSPEADRIYRMSKGDYFLVKVCNKNKTMATRIQEMLYNADFAPERIMVSYGGMIKDEGY